MIDGAEYPLWPANTGGYHYTKTTILAEVVPKGCFIAPEIIRPVGSHSNRPVFLYRASAARSAIFSILLDSSSMRASADTDVSSLL